MHGICHFRIHGLLLGFCATWYKSVQTFQRKVQPPSSGRVILVDMDADVLGKKGIQSDK
jgi:hypothetical protein